MDKVYSVDEVAQILDIHPETIRRWIRNGELKAGMKCDKWGYAITAYDLAVFSYNSSELRRKYGDKIDKLGCEC